AIAAEVAVKSALNFHVGSDQVDLLDLVTGKSREFASASVLLYDVPCRAVLGRSLKVDDRPLYNLVKHLFEERNSIAHTGHVRPEPGRDISGEIAAARRAHEWLDECAKDLGSEWD